MTFNRLSRFTESTHEAKFQPKPNWSEHQAKGRHYWQKKDMMRDLILLGIEFEKEFAHY